jgi:hypothetical protein
VHVMDRVPCQSRLSVHEVHTPCSQCATGTCLMLTWSSWVSPYLAELGELTAGEPDATAREEWPEYNA